MVSLFYSVTGGNDWGTYADLMKSLGTHYFLFFFFYIAFLTFAVLNILTGIFVDSAMQYSSEDRTETREAFQKDAFLKGTVLQYLEVCDDDASGSLDRREFENHLQSEAMQLFLCKMEMTEQDARQIFDRLLQERPEGSLSLETILDCAINLRGPARSLHLHEMMAHVDTIRAETDNIRAEVKHICLAQKQMTSDLHKWIQALGSGEQGGSAPQHLDCSGVVLEPREEAKHSSISL